MLVLPNLKNYSNDYLSKFVNDDTYRADAERVVELIIDALRFLAASKQSQTPNGTSNDLENLRDRLNDKVGEVLTDRIITANEKEIAQFLVKENIGL